MLIDRRDQVLAVPNDAVRSVREAATAAAALGLDPEAVMAQMRTAFNGGGAPSGATPASAQPSQKRCQWVATLAAGMKLALIAIQPRRAASLTKNGYGLIPATAIGGCGCW